MFYRLNKCVATGFRSDSDNIMWILHLYIFTLCFYVFYYWNKQRYVRYRHLLYLFIVKKTEKFRALQHNYNIVSTSRPSYFIISSKFLQFHSNCPGVFVVILSMRLVLLIENNRTDFWTAKQPVLCTMSNYIETGFLHLNFFWWSL